VGNDGSEYRGAAHVGNPVSLPDLDSSPVLAQVAAGFSTLTAYKERIAEGRGLHDGARWLVTIHIPLGGEFELVPGLAAGAESIVAFAVWDGSHEERGSRKSWSPAWTPIMLAE
jgi:DMSO reductase family type II enzyme heme b subunit